MQVGAYNERIRLEAILNAISNARDLAQGFIFWLDNDPNLQYAKEVQASFVNEANGPLLDDLRNRAERNSVDVMKEIKLSSDEIARRRQAQTLIKKDGSTHSPHISPYEFVSIGRLRGVGCFKCDISTLARSIDRNAMALLRKSHGAMGG